MTKCTSHPDPHIDALAAYFWLWNCSGNGKYSRPSKFKRRFIPMKRFYPLLNVAAERRNGDAAETCCSKLVIDRPGIRRS